MMSNPDASFEPYRRRLLGLAYRMLGSMADAEDAVQEAYLRWHGTDRKKVSDPRAFLMTTTTRICLDMLTSARARHEEYVGPWLPEPVVDTAALAPDSRTELAEDLSIALLLTLDRLSPLERAAFLLHDVFDFSFSEVASALERSDAACRQLAARARAHVRAARPRGTTAPPERSGEIEAKHTQLMSAFAAATQSGDLNALMQLLASDVHVVTDGGGKVRAALNVVDGADRAARFLVDATRKRAGAWWRDDFTLRFATINGLPGVIVDGPEGPVQTAAFEIDGDVIRALYVVRNPDKLRHLAAATTHERGPGYAPAAKSPNAFDAENAVFALTEYKEHTNMKPKNTICLWFDKDAQDAARFYAATFPDSKVTAVHEAPSDYPGGKQGDVLTVEFTVLGIPCLGLNGGPEFRHSEAFSFQIATDNQEETDRYWNAIVGNGGKESQCGWCKDRWGLSWQITPRALTDALVAGGGEAKRAFEAMMPMKKIDVATIEAARRG